MKSTGYVFKGRNYIGSAEPPATVLEDESRFPNDGAFLSDGEPNWVQNARGLWVMDFDGSNDYVTIPNHASLEVNHHTLKVWVKTSGETSSLLHKARGTNYGGDYTLNIAGGEARYIVVTDTGSALITFSNNVADGSWHLVIVTYDGNHINGYFDGEYQTQDVQTGTILKTGDPLWIGVRDRGVSGKDMYLTGMIGKVWIYNRALSAGKIKQVFEAERHWYGV